MAQQGGSVKAFLGVATPVYLAPLLFFENLALPCAVLLVVIFTVLETLPLPIVSLVPWVATLLLGRSTPGYEDVLDLSGAELVPLTGFLIVYVLADSTRLWTKLSALVLRWQGARVGLLFASLMSVAFVASLVLPSTFVTLLLAAFVCRHMENIQAHVAVLEARGEMRSAHPPRQAPPASKARDERLKPRAPRFATPRSPSSRSAFRRASHSLPVPDRGPSGALVRVDDIVRQLVTAIRSACIDSPRLQHLRSKRHSLTDHSVDMPASTNSVAIHGSTISATARMSPQQHRPRVPMVMLGAQAHHSPTLVHGDNVETTATLVPSARTVWSDRRARYTKTRSDPKSPKSQSTLSLSQSVDDAARASKGSSSRSKSTKADTPPHTSQLHNIPDVPSGSSSQRDRRATGAILEASPKSPLSPVWPSVDQSQQSRPLSPRGSPTLRISSISGAATRASKGTPLRGTTPPRANGPSIGESWSALHSPLDSSKQSNGPGESVVEWRSRGTSSPGIGLRSPRATPSNEIAPMANTESLKTGQCTPKHSQSSGRHPYLPSRPSSVSSQLSQVSLSGVGSPATPSQIGTMGSKLEHSSFFKSYASETQKSGHEHSSVAPRDGNDCLELGTHQENVLLNATWSPAPGRQDDTATERKIEASNTLYRRIQKVLILGAAYTSIIAGECGLKGRTRVIINDYYANQKKPSPLNAAVFGCCLVPASLVSITLFLIFVYHFYLRNVMREVMVILLLVAIGISLIVDSDKHIGVDSTTVTSLCAVVAVGLPQKLGNLVLAEHVVTWQLILRRLPWELILVRLGGSALQVVAERSRVSTWLLETLLRNVNTRVHPAWCLVALMAATALVCEVDTGVAGFPLVHKLILLSERFQLHPLYFLLPVLMQSRCVLLVPYTSTPLAFIHLYTHMRSAELYWLGLLLKVIFCLAFVVAANTMLFV
ncbi:uncharacterized protein [Dermacentor albipictus]|uniref:uncharacterized protein isoform X2 n=1 Tax=Dermacentor albipictus TaxID=60249 RepID=UPI0038FCB4BA